MKVLAIRGKNLASLDKFDIDLRQGPLSETRMFAITGPTGAGKSTLLDALCIALYDRTPRLSEARHVPTDEEGISAGDPRGILRRGTAEGFAEVDFLGSDGHIYRSRWEVWRARKKPEGRLQDQRVQLFEIDGASVHDRTEAKRTATLETIRNKIGLDFEQFRRAILLAQGDFSAFLRSKADERAELLERMTQTEVYARLSRRAFLEARLRTQEAASIKAQWESITVLPDHELEPLRERLLAHRARLKASERALEKARAKYNWHEQFHTLLTELKEAEQQKQAAQEAEAELPTLETKIQDYDLIAQAKPLSKSKTELQRGLEEEKARLARCRTEVEQAEVQGRRASERCRHARMKLKAAEESRAQAMTKIERATVQQEQIDHLELSLVQRKRQLTQAKVQLQEGRSSLEMGVSSLDSLAQEQSEDDAWLELQPLSIQQAEQALKAQAALSPQLEEVVQLQTKLHSLSGREQKAKSNAEEAAQRVESLEQSYAAASRAVHEVRESSPLSTDERLLADLGGALRRLRSSASKARKRSAEAKQREKTAAALSARTESWAQDVETLLKSGEATSIRNSLLRPQQPCPLCGSTDHAPHQTPAPDPSIRVGELGTQALRFEQQRLAYLEAEQEAETESYRALKERLQSLWLESGNLYKLGLAKAGLLLPKSLPTSVKALGPALLVLEEVEAQFELQRLESVRSKHAARSAELTQTRLEAELLAAKAVYWEKKHSLSEISEEHARCADVLEQAKACLIQHTGTTDLSLAAFREKTQALEQFLQKASSLAHKTEVRRAKAEAVKRGVEEARKTEARWLEEVKRQTAELNQLEVSMEEQRSSLKALLGEKEISSWKKEVQSNFEQAQAGVRAAETEAEESAARESKARSELQLRQTEEAVQDSKLQAVKTKLCQLQEQTSPEVWARIEPQFEMVLPERGTFEARKRAILQQTLEAETRYQDRLQRQRVHLEGGLNAGFIDEGALKADLSLRQPKWKDALRPLVQEHQKETDQHRKALADVSRQLELDAELRRNREALLPQVDSAQQQAQLWAELTDLIGSADGKKMRRFAQALTLEVLVDQANLHLRELRPRYRLERVVGTDMELQILDLDMGEELRPVASLSGGETFLVSLSLALGLSDLSSNQVPIDSLFIDEGFGALDRDSLEMALSALDQLQAQGRTVAVVSHLPEVAERMGYEVMVQPVAPGRSIVSAKAP